MKRFLSLMLAGVAGGVVFFLLYFFIINDQPVEKEEAKPEIPVQTVANMLSPDPAPPVSFVESAAITVHAVVHIKARLKQRNQIYNRFFDIFDAGPRYYERTVVASGSGVIISRDGYIVTNNHVVQNAFELEVTLNDRRVYKGKIVGTDPATDLALIKIEEDNLPYLVFGDSDKVLVGEWVLAVGNPFNLTSTVTAGIVSAKARNINILGMDNAIESFIQTDAAVNPGNSGGALVNIKGELIGINAAIASNTGSYAGYAFAIPSNLVRKVVEDLKLYGKTQRAYLGISYAEIDAKYAEYKGLDEVKGISIEGVIENSAADDAGLQRGDVLLAIDGKEINSQSELTEALGTKRPGDTVLLTVRRGDDVFVRQTVLKNEIGQTSVSNPKKLEILGATIEELSPDELKYYGLTYGYKVTRLKNGILKSAGIREGFIITELNHKPVLSLSELKSYLLNHRGGVLLGGMYENGRRAYYGFGI